MCSRPAAVLGLAAALLAGGCQNIFVPKHKVLVDAIAAPGATKPVGLSYRLVGRKSMVSNMPVQVPVIIACVDAALGTAGMYPAPSNVPPDLFIEVGYGQDTTPRVDPAVRETHLQLSARSNPTKSLDKASGPELWDVRVAVLGISNRFENALPLLCSVAVTYAATDTHKETRIDVPQNAATIAQVRENAIRALETKPTPPPSVPTAAAAPNAAQGGNPPPATPGK